MNRGNCFPDCMSTANLEKLAEEVEVAAEEIAVGVVNFCR